jgi:endonuclease/exonuclease/phosphatase family metal-dependent hydrolase
MRQLVTVWALLLGAGISCAAADTGAPRTLRFLTYNVWGLPAPITIKKSRFKDIPRVAPGLDADVLAFQETFTRKARPLAELEDYPFHVWGPGKKFPRISAGLLIVSRWPIVESARMVYDRCAGTDCAARKGALYARVRIDGAGDIDVFTTHLNAAGPDSLRTYQVEQLVKFIARHAGPRPLVVMGDFNIRPGTPPYDRLRQLTGLRDTHVEFVAAHPELSQYEKDGFTSDKRYNPNLPREDVPGRIDYVFVASDGLELSTARSKMVFDAPVNGRFLSDHFGLAADLELETVNEDPSAHLVGAPAHGVVGVLD